MSDGLRADPQEGAGLEADPTVNLSESAPDGGIDRIVLYHRLCAIARGELADHTISPGEARYLERLVGREPASSGAVLVGDRRGQAGSGDDGNRGPGGGES